jgi:hypothetical protein
MAGITKEERARRAAAKDAVLTPAAPSTSTEIPATTTGELNQVPTGVTIVGDSGKTGFARNATITPETLVSTPEGDKPISDLKVGELVNVIDEPVEATITALEANGEPGLVVEVVNIIKNAQVYAQTQPLSQAEICAIQMAQNPIHFLSHKNG